MTLSNSTPAPSTLLAISIAFFINKEVIIPSTIGETDKAKHVTITINIAVKKPHL